MTWMVLTDARWRVLEPLAEACRLHRKTQLHHLRRTMEAIIWRCQNGAKWRTVPLEYGAWWMAAQTFIRWGRHGVWERLLSLAQEKGVRLGMVFLDGSNIRAHQKAAGAAKKGIWSPTRYAWALGRSRGGYGTKACVIADGGGRAIAFSLAPGQAHELPMACAQLSRLAETPSWVAADRRYTSHAFREHIWSQGSRPAIPPQRPDAPVACPAWIYNNRNRVERLGAAQGMACGRHALRENRSILPR
jgi:transposase